MARTVDNGWKRAFDEAIVLPDGRKLVTLLDAATYATKLPKKEADTGEWQARDRKPDAVGCRRRGWARACLLGHAEPDGAHR